MITLTNFDFYANKRVSFIVTTKNSANELDKCLAVCRGLKSSEDEILVIDGASTDKTAEVVKKYADMVDVFVSEDDLSNTHASNKGMLLARGRYLKSIAPDDTYYPEAMEQAIAALEEHPEIDVLLCGGTKEKNGKVGYVYIPSGSNYGDKPEDVFLYPRCGVGHIYRRKSLARMGIFDLRSLNTDSEFLIHAIYSGAIVRFCRVNLFHHPFSHYDQEFYTDKFWLSVAKRYCSRQFYFKYLLFIKFRRSKVIHFFYYLTKLIRRNIKNSAIKRFLGKKILPEIIWDGGFS